MTNSNGVVTDSYKYNASGDLLSSVGTTQNVYRFAGQAVDPVLGLYYLRSRYMDPSTGRFLGEDAFPGNPEQPITTNHYLYANSDPVNGVDPNGNLTFLALGAAGGFGILSIGVLAYTAYWYSLVLNGFPLPDPLVNVANNSLQIVREWAADMTTIPNGGPGFNTWFDPNNKASIEGRRRPGLDLNPQLCRWTNPIHRQPLLLGQASDRLFHPQLPVSRSQDFPQSELLQVPRKQRYARLIRDYSGRDYPPRSLTPGVAHD